MAKLVLEFILPIVALGVGFAVIIVYRKVQMPSPLVWGLITQKVGPVRVDSVLEYVKQNASDEPRPWHARRDARRQQFKVHSGFLSAEVNNSTLFLQALLFEKEMIDKNKSGLKYEPKEIAIMRLIEEAIGLRWAQFRCQVVLGLRGRLGMRIDKDIYIALLAQYKGFEKNIIDLAEVEAAWLRAMLVERLGLMNWRVLEGGGSGPDPA